MNKTTFKNHYNKYFEQLVDSTITNIVSNKVDTLQISYLKEKKEKTLTIKAEIERNENGLLEFQFNLGLQTPLNNEFETVLPDMKKLTQISLFEAEDMFCKEQALELQCDTGQYCHILIYTDMAEMTLEFFKEKLEVEKFKKVSF